MTDFNEEREQICEIGRRMYARQFVAAHEGNLSIRLSNNSILCTPTMMCKGLLSPEDLCIVDREMNLISGTRKATSEIRLHLEIFRQREDINAVVHSHAPHATAFAVANRPFPCGILAEPDLFLGEVALAPFQVPGTQAFAESVLPFVQQTNAIMLANHGLVTYAEELEKAFWMTEILDAACKTLILSMNVGGPQRLSREHANQLAMTREKFGFEDPRDLNDPGIDVRQNVLFSKQMDLDGFDRSFFDS